MTYAMKRPVGSVIKALITCQLLVSHYQFRTVTIHLWEKLNPSEGKRVHMFRNTPFDCLVKNLARKNQWDKIL